MLTVGASLLNAVAKRVDGFAFLVGWLKKLLFEHSTKLGHDFINTHTSVFVAASGESESDLNTEKNDCRTQIRFKAYHTCMV